MSKLDLVLAAACLAAGATCVWIGTTPLRAASAVHSTALTCDTYESVHALFGKYGIKMTDVPNGFTFETKDHRMWLAVVTPSGCLAPPKELPYCGPDDGPDWTALQMVLAGIRNRGYHLV